MSIEVQAVSKSYGTQLALNKISFSAKKGEIIGFLGPNGAGKSTMMKLLTGYILPNTGTISPDIPNPFEGENKSNTLETETHKTDFRQTNRPTDYQTNRPRDLHYTLPSLFSFPSPDCCHCGTL